MWTCGGADRRAPGHGGALIGVGPPATLGHGRSPVKAEDEERSMGIPLQASPGLEQ
jgi:hypothetical protein